MEGCPCRRTLEGESFYEMAQNDPPRSSRRVRGEEPPTILEDPHDNPTYTRELSMLKKKGGVGGKFNVSACKWDYFPKKMNRYMSRGVRDKHNESVFNGINDLYDNKHDFENDTRQNNSAAYQLLNLHSLERLMEDKMMCRCAVDTEIDSFISFCSQRRDTELTCDVLKELKNKWKVSHKRSNKIKINVEHIGIEPIMSIECPMCNKKQCIDNQMTRFHGENYDGKASKHENCSWYASNVKLVLGTLASGMGASDMSSFVSFLGLPNVQSFSRTQFHRIELRIGKFLREVAETSMQAALEIEVQNTLKNIGIKIEDWKKYVHSIGLTTSYDMGWNKRSSGNRYDSLSGFAFLIGCLSRKIILAQVTSKACSVCTAAEGKGSTPPVHECPMNYHGSSKGMEAEGALSLVLQLDRQSDSKLFIEKMVTDDDASIRAIVAHAKNPKSKGRLPLHIPEPRFLADPSHRTRVVARAIFALATLNLDQSECRTIDAMRFKRYFGFMLKQARNLTIEEMSVKFKAVVEHLFNNHLFCSPEWCKPLRAAKNKTNDLPICCPVDLGDRLPSPDSPEPNETPQWYYRSKEEHPKLYSQILNAYAPYTTPERIAESNHPYDTQLNESLNNVVSRYAPKNRTYGTTMSLSNRIAIVIGVHNLGHLGFWKEVYHLIGLPMSTDLHNNLLRKDGRKDLKRKYNEKKEVKSKRAKKNHDKTKDMIKKQIADAKRGATYRSGIALEDIIPKSVVDLENDLRKEGKVRCKFYGCHGVKHRTKASKDCTYHKYKKNSLLKSAMDAKLRSLYPHCYGE